MRKNYRPRKLVPVRLPKEVVDRVRADLQRDGTWGSVAAWVQACVIRRLEEVEGRP